jgi:WD repeat-containing protein 26
VSGSEGTLFRLLRYNSLTKFSDGNVYVWDRDTGTLLEILDGHGEGSVNSVAWNPKNERMFASCSDDHTVRIWEAPVFGNAHVDPTLRMDTPEPEASAVSGGNGKGKGKVALPSHRNESLDGQDVDGVSSSRL